MIKAKGRQPLKKAKHGFIYNRFQVRDYFQPVDTSSALQKRLPPPLTDALNRLSIDKRYQQGESVTVWDPGAETQTVAPSNQCRCRSTGPSVMQSIVTKEPLMDRRRKVSLDPSITWCGGVCSFSPPTFPKILHY